MRLGTFVLVSLSLAGCAGTEVGNPPFSPEVPDPGYAPDRAAVRPDTEQDLADAFSFSIPSSEVGEGAVMTVANLDRFDPTAELVLVGDVYRASIRAQVGEVVRYQLRTASGRKTPVDYLTVELERLALHSRELEDCLRFEKSDVGAASGAASLVIRMRNDCDDPISIAAPRLRLGTSFELEQSAPFELATGEIASIEVAVTNETDGEDHVLLDVTAPVAERFAITVHSGE